MPERPASVVSSGGEHPAGVGVVVGEAFEVDHAVVVDRDDAHDRLYRSEPGTAAARLGRATAVVLSDLSGPARAQLRRRVPARSASPSES